MDEYIQVDFREIQQRCWTAKIVKPDEEIPNLFHYTDGNGLIGILGSSSLWSTHFQSLNDASEMHYGRSLAWGLADTAEPGDKRRFLLRTMEIADSVIVQGATPYVVSFCSSGDLLSQWREYGGRGAGYSIAFGFKELSALFDATSVLPITYDPGIQREILNCTFEEYWSVRLRWAAKCNGIESRCQDDMV